MDDTLYDKKLLIGIPVLNMGGTEMHTLLLARAMISAGMNVSVCCYHEYSAEVVKMFTDLKIDVHLLQLPRSLGGMSYYELKNVYSSFTRIIKKINPDVIHIQYVAPGLVPILAARQKSSAVITAAVHTSGAYLYGGKARLMIKTASRLCDAFVAVSNDVKSFWFGNSSNDKFPVIYNGLDVTESELILSEINRDESKKQFSLSGKPLFTIVGRAGRHKGHDILFRAAVQLKNRFSDFKIVVAGEPVEKDFLENLAAELHIESHIIWLGILPREELIRVVASSDCLVIPSRYEGFGLTALEAMSVGVPVIASAVGGLPEIIHHEESGLLVPSEDYHALADAMQRMMDDNELRNHCITAGKKLVQEKFSFERFSTEWSNLFSQLTESVR